MSKRLITATVGLAFGALALGMLATAADARPHQGTAAPATPITRIPTMTADTRAATQLPPPGRKHSGKRYATKRGQRRSYAAPRRLVAARHRRALRAAA